MRFIGMRWWIPSCAIVLCGGTATAQDLNTQLETLSVRGTFIDSKTRQPVPRVEVTLVRLGEENPKGGLMSGLHGQFAFTGLREGTYRLEWQHPDYAGSDEASTIVPDKAFMITRTQQHSDGTIFIHPLGAISGQALYENGQPVKNATVIAQSAINSRDAQDAELTGTTDDTGAFRISRVLPGQYRIAVSLPPAFGSRPGLQTGMGTIQSSEPSQKSFPVITYAPGVLRPQDAQVTPITYGSTVRDVRISVPYISVYRISGRVRVPTGLSPTAIVCMLLPDMKPKSLALEGRRRVAVRQDGTFSIPYVVPGDYVLSASGQMPDRGWQASLQVSVAQSDVRNVELHLLPQTEVQIDLKKPDGLSSSVQISCELHPDGNLMTYFAGKPESAATFRFSRIAGGDYAVTCASKDVKDVYVSALDIYGRTVDRNCPEFR